MLLCSALELLAKGTRVLPCTEWGIAGVTNDSFGLKKTFQRPQNMHRARQESSQRSSTWTSGSLFGRFRVALQVWSGASRAGSSPKRVGHSPRCDTDPPPTGVGHFRGLLGNSERRQLRVSCSKELPVTRRTDRKLRMYCKNTGIQLSHHSTMAVSRPTRWMDQRNLTHAVRRRPASTWSVRILIINALRRSNRIER